MIKSVESWEKLTIDWRRPELSCRHFLLVMMTSAEKSNVEIIQLFIHREVAKRNEQRARKRRRKKGEEIKFSPQKCEHFQA